MDFGKQKFPEIDLFDFTRFFGLDFFLVFGLTENKIDPRKIIFRILYIL